jgi:hypothetical protein
MTTLDQLNNLELNQVRALACQNKIENWREKSRGTLLRELVKVSEENGTDLLGVRG